VVELAGREDVGEHDVSYLNRLSDALFVWGRWCSLKDGQPLGTRGTPDGLSRSPARMSALRHELRRAANDRWRCCGAAAPR
jgi:hypothetical protein